MNNNLNNNLVDEDDEIKDSDLRLADTNHSGSPSNEIIELTEQDYNFKNLVNARKESV